MKHRQRVALALMFGSIAAPAGARVQWDERVVPQAEVVLQCKERREMSQSRAETVARLRGLGLVGHVNEVEAAIRGMLREDGWGVRGHPGDPNARFVLTYYLAYRVPIQFGLDADGTGMTTRVRQGLGGKFESSMPRSSMRYAADAHQAQIRRQGQQFSAAREAEVAHLKSWHRRRHPWTAVELRELGLRTAGEFGRSHAYTFCGQQRGAHFRARWRRDLGPLGQ